MIVKNEEKTLGRCLSSVQNLVDEIIVVDTGSTDGTKAVARQYTNKIFDLEWVDDFSAARNYAFSFAAMDFVLWLDADDFVKPEDAEKFARLKQGLTLKTDVVMLPYNTGFDADGKVVFSFFRERLVRRSAGFVWQEPVHEYIQTCGKVLRGDACITHGKVKKEAGGRNLRIYETLLQGKGELSPRGKYYYARELRDAGRYADAAKQFDSFLTQGKGWVEDNIAACGALSDCYCALGDKGSALKSLLRSFEYDSPRPEICCRLGYYFQQKARYDQAAYWFELALSSAKDLTGKSIGFRQEDYYGFIPCIELAVCFDKLGDTAKAYEYNERAAVYKPNSKAVNDNREYFRKRGTD